MDSGVCWAEYTQCWSSGNGEEQQGQGVWPVTAIGFDVGSEVLYAGDTSGQLTTYGLGLEGEELEQLASVQCAHTPIRRLYAAKAGRVFVQTDDSVQVRTAGGRKCFGRTTTPNDAFTASTLSSTGKEAFVCTSAGAGSLLNLEMGSVAYRASVESSVVAVDYRPDALFMATSSGDLVLRDPRAGFSVSLAKRAAFGSGPGCHATDMVRTMDTRVFACGSPSTNAAEYAEPGAVVRLFDVRKMSEPVLDLEPEYSHVPVRLYADEELLWICHDSGLLTARSLAVDSMDVAPPPAEAYAEPPLSSYAYMSAFGVAPSGSVAVVSDTDGILHVWSDSTEPQMSTGIASDLYVPPVVFDNDGPLVDDESVPLSSIQMGAPVDSPLLSCMDNEWQYDVGRPVAYVEARVLGSLKQMGAVGYAPNPRTQRRNQQPFASPAWRQSWRNAGGPADDDDDELTRGRPKFISQQQRSRRNQDAVSARASSRSGDPADRSTADLATSVDQQQATTALAPSQLRRMRIEYSRFGVEDFDFSLYNGTRWSGLEGDVSNAYANALLQLLYFADGFCNIVVAHSRDDRCSDASCLSCHLGFLFRMLSDANGASCHASLLLRVLAERPEAAALALLEDADGNPATATPYAVLAQHLLRFVLEQVANECKLTSEPPIGFAQRTHTVCPACGTAAERTAHVFAADLEPPQGSAALASLLAGGAASVRRADTQRASDQPADFLSLVSRALARSDTTRAWCAGCRSFQLLRTDKRITAPPAGILALNFPVLDAAWQLSLPNEFDLEVSADGDCPVRALPPGEGTGQQCRMQLAAVVSSIRDTPKGAEHLVVHVREPQSAGGGWLLLNDFLVQPVAESSVVTLGDWWRTPSIALYALASGCEETLRVETPVTQCHTPPSISSTLILTAPTSVLDSSTHKGQPTLTMHQRRRAAKAVKPHHSIPRTRLAAAKRNMAVPLTQAEAVRLLTDRSFRCALDAEFVVLEAAKMEVFGDGTRELHRPPVHTLARLSVVRANGGLLHGVPFIDDYVAATRPIEDLATQYSGIHAGDLTPGASPHKLSTMKEVYRKLRLLVDAKAIIIGHGLKHDFRVCNIVVPAAQLRDTMALFQSPSHIRPISLRFLYWYFERKVIQSGEHSSVEDAQATLKVYEHYVECVNKDPENGLENTLNDIYATGSQLGWKVPESGLQ
ncbi:poly(A)-specific ribonuclease [Coemansia aciculifera]|uniref:Poly(A)-specific ribonuclease n=2 Tax=Coemansia TaxID=4863 RepID=A0A9W8IU66_9FUNG|nr:poly(A)-specific ribonuclease [Coemansia aciculifera]